MISVVNSDIMTSPATTLVVPVNTQSAMGAVDAIYDAFEDTSIMVFVHQPKAINVTDNQKLKLYLSARISPTINRKHILDDYVSQSNITSTEHLAYVDVIITHLVLYGFWYPVYEHEELDYMLTTLNKLEYVELLPSGDLFLLKHMCPVV